MSDEDSDIVFIRFEGYQRLEKEPTYVSRELLDDAIKGHRMHYVRTDPDGYEVYAATDRSMKGPHVTGRFAWIVDCGYRRGQRHDNGGDDSD